MKSIYLIFFISLSFISSSLIFENTPTYVEKYRLHSDLKEIMNKRIFQKHTFANIEQTIDDETLTLASIVPTSHFIFPEETDFILPESGSKKYTIEFNKDLKKTHNLYLARYSALLTSNKQQGKTYKVNFSITFSYFSLTKEYTKYQDKYFYTATGECNLYLALAEKDYSNVQNISKDSIDALLASLLSKEQDGLINEFKTKGVDSYYASIKIDEVTKDISTNTRTNTILNHKLDLNRDNAPDLIKTGNITHILNYFSGSVDDSAQTDTHELTISYDADKYGIYIHKDLFKNLLQKSLFGMYLENSTKFIDDYDLTIKSLKKICPTLSYPDNLTFTIETTMNSINFGSQDLTKDGIKAKITLTSVYYSTEDMSKILSYNWDLDVLLRFNLFHYGLNFIVLGKDTTVSNFVGKDELIVDKDLLLEWTDLTIKVGLGRNQYDLFNKYFDLTEYFNNYKDITLDVNGDYITLVGMPKV